jgi:hypothetical protein
MTVPRPPSLRLVDKCAPVTGAVATGLIGTASKPGTSNRPDTSLNVVVEMFDIASGGPLAYRHDTPPADLKKDCPKLKKRGLL